MDINNFIKDLSIKDKKNLSQKGLKLVEEVGELARAILPYDSAPGTNHRFIDKEAILEEVVDVYLTNISIAHSIGVSDDEFNEMLIKKSKKWSQLQVKEDKGSFPLPFEIHITVDCKNSYNFNIEEFREDCLSIDVKPIILDLEINGELPMKDVMTSSKHFGDNKSAYDECDRIAKALISFGYNVIRRKIETVPWHPAAPTNTGLIPNNCYFESHIGVIILPNEKEHLNEFVNDLNNKRLGDVIIQLSGSVKLSQNFFKKSKDGSKFVNMLTYRSSITSKDEFEDDVNTIKEGLKTNGFEFEKVEVEYAIYDTNVSHDIKWING